MNRCLAFIGALLFAFIVSGVASGAHWTLPVSSATINIFSEHVICQAISLAVRDFGSGR